MGQYSFVFLLNEKDELKNLKGLVDGASGKVLEEKSLGKKTLAYPIKKQGSAEFFEWTLELNPDQLTEFKKKVGFNEKLLRYLLLKVE